MLDVKQVATIALSAALTDWEAGCPLSLATVREIRLAHSLLSEGVPNSDELRPFLGARWVIRSTNRSLSRFGANAVSETEYALAQIRALAVRLGMPERFVADLLRRRCPNESAVRSRSRLG